MKKRATPIFTSLWKDKAKGRESLSLLKICTPNNNKPNKPE